MASSDAAGVREVASEVTASTGSKSRRDPPHEVVLVPTGRLGMRPGTAGRAVPALDVAQAPLDLGHRVLDRLAASLAFLRAASVAAFACAAAAVAALSALVCASFWSADRPVLSVPSAAPSGAAAASTAKAFDVVRCWDFRSEIRTP